jgi:two-component system, NarL family, nitrate/nitrite response regulator NarL
MADVIRLLLIDDHSLFREGLRRLLMAEAGFQIVASCGHLAEALKVLSREQIDVVLLDYDLGAEQGSALLDEIKPGEGTPKILMVTAGMTSASMVTLLQQGASGIFLKHSPPTKLVEAIWKVMDNELWLDPQVVRPVLDRAIRGTEPVPTDPWLNAREKAVLNAVLNGASNKRIAATLHLSESSVKAVLQRLFDKTGVRTRSQLVRLTLEKHAHDWLA